MRTRYAVALALLAGAAIGAVSVGGLSAQSKAPGAYAVFVYTAIPDPAGFSENVSKDAKSVIEGGGGHILARAASPKDFTVLRAGENPFPLTRWVLIGFDSAEQAKKWYDSPAAASGRAYVEKNTTGRAYVVEALKE
ncbi:MAG TPA: DUF1330 domain-containing protein [Xanthobacteraceae bacterium]|nr:DUF1330 domain-containing protein [Xanthobacteraceae bacterium]